MGVEEDGCTTTDHAMRLVLQKAYKFGSDLQILLTDSKQAYDMVDTKQLCQTFKRIWDPQEIG